MKSIILICIILVTNCTTTFAQKCDSLTNANGNINHYYCPQKAKTAWCTISTIIDNAIVQPITTNKAYEIANGSSIDFVVCSQAVPYGDERLPSLFLGGDFEISFMMMYKKSPIGMTVDEIRNEEEYKKDSIQKNDPIVKKVRDVTNAITEDEYALAAGKSGNITAEAIQKFAKNTFVITIYFNSTQKDVFHFEPNFTIKKSTPISMVNLKPLLAMDVLHFNHFYDTQNLDVTEKYIKESNLYIYDSYVRLGSFLSDAESEKMRINGVYNAKNITVKITGGGFEANRKILQEINWTKLLEALK